MDWEKVADYLEKFSSELSATANNLASMTNYGNPVVQSSNTTASTLSAIARALRAGLPQK
jgi:hypothetical protein